MVARFRVLLPFSLSVRAGDELRVYEFRQNSYVIRVYPPCQAAVDPADLDALSPIPARQVLDQIRPADPQMTGDAITIAGVSTIQANLIQLDFEKDHFDRRKRREDEKERGPDVGEPPIGYIFDVLNGVLSRLRAITRGSNVRSVDFETSFWRIDYLNEDGSEMPPDPELLTKRLAAPLRIVATGFTRDVWERTMALGANFTQMPWDRLLLDAGAILPEINASIVLAYTALETFAAWCSNELGASATMPPDLWEWINDRGDYYKEPSVEERFDSLLRFFAGHSLKENVALWGAFLNLRKARNSFSHQGRATVLDGQQVSTKLAYELIRQAKEIVDWVELRLPENMRRPKPESFDVVFRKWIVAPLRSGEPEVK